MENNHLTYFKIENFKKFDSLEVNDIGQFNLIVGDNNVGKTCLLEALLVDETNHVLSNANFLVSSINRGLINYDTVSKVSKFFIYSHIVRKGNEINYQINKKKYTLKFGDAEVDFSEIKESLKNHFDNDIFKLELNYSFLKKANPTFNYPMVSFLNKEYDIVDMYNFLSTKKEKEELIKTLKVIFPLLEDIEYKAEFKQIINTFVFTFEDKEEFVPLNYLGDGFKRIFYTALKTLSLKGKRIMVDEIEIGIHHSRQKDFWINIIKICIELNVQLFATTHSQECINAYCLALEELKLEENGKVILLQEEKEKIVSYTFETKNLDLAFDYRG